MKYIYKFTYLVIILLLIGVSINFVYANPSTSYVISIHTDAYTKNKYEGGAHVIGSGNFANRLQAGLSTSADKYKVFKKQGVGQTAVDDGNATLKVARRAGVTNAALIEVGAHSLLLDQYGTPSGVASSQYVDNLISNVIGPNVSGSGKIIIPMDHTRKRIPDKTGGNTYEGSNQTGAAPYNGYVERDVTDTIAAKIKAKFGDRVVIIKPEDYNSYQEYDAAIVRAVGGTATTDPSTSSAPSTATPTTTAGTVSYQSYTNFPGVGRISSLCQLITALWLLGFAVLLTSVLGMFLYGGYMYVTAGVNAGKVNQAKEIFTNTLTGLIIGLSIFIIINIINPGLLQGNCSIPSVGSGATIGGPPSTGTPGGPTASVVDVGRFIESRMGLRVSEHSAWNGGRPITTGHSPGSLHYSDRALDITDWRRPGEAESVWKPRMRALDRAWSPIASKYGIQFFGPASDPIGHPTHIHLGFPTGSVSSAALDEMLAAERQVLQQHPLR